jgi:hypothetical protein
LPNLITWFGKYALYRWCHDIGREQAANRPLLKTIFEVKSVGVRHEVLILSNNAIFLMSYIFSQVLMRLFSPRKTTLLLVIRDKTKVCTVLEADTHFCSTCAVRYVQLVFL